MYVSKFVNFYSVDQNETLLFHGVTGAVDVVERSFGHRLRRIQDSKQSADLEDIPVETKNTLRSRGYLLDLNSSDEQQEYESYVKRLHDLKRVAKSGYLMLIPTYDCNLRCPYCFQNYFRDSNVNNCKSIMTEELVETYFDKTIPQFFGEITEKISMTLYGGEPFSASTKGTVGKILEYCERREVPVTAITNGTMVQSMIEFFGPDYGKVNGVQISLDGIPEIHDRSRVPAGGGATFFDILKNVKILSDHKCNVAIRINTSPNSAKSLDKLHEILIDEDIITRENVSAYCRAIHLVAHTPTDVDFPETFSQWHLSKEMEQLRTVGIRSPVDRACKDLNGILNREGVPKLDRTSFCMQNKPFALILDNLGDVYGCYDEAGYKDKRIGIVNKEGIVELFDLYERYQSRTVISHEPCRSCKVGLTCGGGCPAQAELANGSIFSQFCDSHKELVASSLIEMYKKGKLHEVEQNAALSDTNQYAPML